MTAIPQLPQPTATPGDEMIDLHQLAAALQRQWRLIAKIAGAALALSTLYALTSPRVWQGEFQIVLASNNQNDRKLSQLVALNPTLSALAGVGSGGSIESLETEVKVLESPSVLKPVFDFVRNRKQLSGQNTEGMRFRDWVKSVKVDLEKGTSVLNISYRDTDKALILPVIDRISREYQDYSGRDRRREIANAVIYLKSSIRELSPKAEASMKLSQAYALSHGLGLGDGMPAFVSGTGASGPVNNGVVEISRQQAQANVLLLQQQLREAQSSRNRTLFQAPQLTANANLYQQYQALEARLSDLRSRLRDNDELVLNLQRQRTNLITTLNRQTIGLLQGQLATAQASLQASSRPDEVVLRHRELVRQALRDEKTLVELENQLQITQLEQAKETEPWELISKPTLLDSPVAPMKSRIMTMGLLAGLVAGSGAALVVDRRSGRVFAADELQQLLPGTLLAHLNPNCSPTVMGQLNLVARGPLAGSHRVALIPVGLSPKAAAIQRLLQQLQERMPHTELMCSTDLVQAANCDHQLLITSLGAPTRSQLAALRQQLQLQNRPVTGWLLLQESGAA
jgi:succinoglycan biosynthesis transport protein ExoP